MQTGMVTFEILSILGFQKSSFTVTAEKFIGWYFCKEGCEKTLGAEKQPIIMERQAIAFRLSIQLGWKEKMNT